MIFLDRIQSNFLFKILSSAAWKLCALQFGLDEDTKFNIA